MGNERAKEHMYRFLSSFYPPPPASLSPFSLYYSTHGCHLKIRDGKPIQTLETKRSGTTQWTYCHGLSQIKYLPYFTREPPLFWC